MISDTDARVEATLARIDAQVEGARSRRAATDAVIEDVRSVRASVRSARGECEVTASANGAVLGIKLARGLQSNTTLESLLIHTIARAQAEAREDAARRAASTLGQQSPFVVQLRNAPGEGGAQ